jgi:hypothetical protein
LIGNFATGVEPRPCRPNPSTSQRRYRPRQGGSLFLFELRFRPFPLLGVVGQRSLLLSLETRSSYSSRCRCARSSEPPSRLAAVPLARTRGGPIRTIPAPTTLSAVIQATEALAPKRSPSEDMLRGLLQTTAFYIGAIVCAAAMTLPCFGCVWPAPAITIPVMNAAPHESRTKFSPISVSPRP